MFRSVRFRITLWYAAALAVTLSLFSVLVYNNLKNNLEENADRLLAYRAEGVADALEAYIATERIETGMPQAAAAQHGAFFKIAPYLLNLHSDDPRLAAVDLKILDTKGREIAASGNPAAGPDMPESTLKDALKGNAAYDDIKMTSEDGAETLYRSYATPASGTAGPAYVVQAYRPAYATQFALRNLRLMMAGLVPLIVLLTGAFGMFFARVALRPVAGMARTIRQITAENLSLRLKPPGTNDEIRELADLFNAMLGRLEDSFLSERRFIQDVSHELKTPLTILKGELEVALKKARTSGEYAAVLQSNLEETEKMSSIVEALLTLARFDNREVRFERTDVDLGGVIETAITSVSVMAEKAGIRIELTKKGIARKVEADRGQLGRLFLNLLDNAIKYGAPGGEVKIRITTEESCSSVKISDNGKGITAVDLPHIFKRFYRADSSRSSSGFGLGLAIAKSIAEAQGAEIKAESTPGRGASFTVRFPLPGPAA